MAGRLSMASVFVIALAALFAMPAAANDQACTRETIGRARLSAEIQPLRAAIEAVFAAAAVDPTTGEVTTDGPSLQMLVVRVENGKPVMACVDTKEAATRFLSAPVAKIRGRAAEEK